MFSNSSSDEPDARAARNAALLRAAIDKEHEQMLRSVVVLVSSTEGLHGPELTERAEEILQMAIVEAMKCAKHFDPTRPARAWIRGIAARLLLNRRRVEARDRRCVPASDLGEEGWAMALLQLRGESDDAAVGARLDLEQALNRVSPEDRRVIRSRYYRGLDGNKLAKALGVPTPEAARVRVCRALRELRDQFRPSEGGFLP
jgi:RNA polymerase sigma-70 factor (ECF subfamily)